MILRLLTLTLLVALLMAGPAAAQAPQPPAGDHPTIPIPRPLLDPVQDEFDAFPRRPVTEASPVVPSTPAVPIGQPGLSFRYVQTFGVAEEPYPADTQHFNRPTASS